MNFDEMLETWRAQNTDALRQALQTEEARGRRELRSWPLWFCEIFGTGMAVWAGLWIAIVISNGWPAFYAIAAGVSFALFALAVVAFWVSHGRQADPEPSFDNTLQEEVRRNLTLVDYQLSVNSRAIVSILASASLVVGALLFSWTVVTSQNIPVSSFGGWLPVLLVVFLVWVFFKARDETREAKAKLETRQLRLRELLAALDARE